jgi:hypothetical protein
MTGRGLRPVVTVAVASALLAPFRPLARLIADERPTAEIRQRWVALARTHLAGAASQNIMEVLYLVFQESVEQMNEDKKYHLQKLPPRASADSSSGRPT